MPFSCYVAEVSNLVRIASTSELPAEGELREFSFGSKTICIANVGGKFTALSAVCPHKGGPLAEGEIEHGNVVCPWHGWEFRLSDGRCQHRPAISVEVFELSIHGENVFLRS